MKISINGYVDAVIFIVLTAFSFVFLDQLATTIQPITMLFIMSGIALIFFNLLNFKQFKKSYRIILEHKLLFVTMSTFLCLDWVFMVFAIYLSDPFVALAALFVSTAISGFIKRFFETGYYSNFFNISLLVVSLVVLYFSYTVPEGKSLGYGLFLGALAGVAFFIYIVSSHLLSSRGNLSSIGILATRFWILFIGSIFFLDSHNVLIAWQQHATDLIVLSFCSLIIPIFFNQQSIKKLGPSLASIMSSAIPLFSSFLEYKNHLQCRVPSPEPSKFPGKY